MTTSDWWRREGWQGDEVTREEITVELDLADIEVIGTIEDADYGRDPILPPSLPRSVFPIRTYTDGEITAEIRIPRK